MSTHCSPEPLPSKPSKPSVSFVNASAFLRAAKAPGTTVFRINLQDPNLQARATNLDDTLKEEDPNDTLKGVPWEYHEFADIFSKTRANTLAPHRLYELKINLEDGTSPPPGPMYSLSVTELEALCEFLDEHLRIGFICPSRSSHGAPILFVRKKDGFL